jgi:hypothetical protein
MLQAFLAALKEVPLRIKPTTNLFRANNLTLAVLETIYKLRRNIRVWKKVKMGKCAYSTPFSNNI